MRRTCGEVVQFMCAVSGISIGVIQLQKLLLFFVGITSRFMRTLYKFFTSPIHRIFIQSPDDAVSYTHITQGLILKKLSFKRLYI